MTIIMDAELDMPRRTATTARKVAHVTVKGRLGTGLVHHPADDAGGGVVVVAATGGCVDVVSVVVLAAPAAPPAPADEDPGDEVHALPAMDSEVYLA